MTPQEDMIVTLATLSDCTAQQVFNHVARHLLKQNKRSIDKHPDHSDLCRYRNGEGLSCSAGSLMSDDEYKPELNHEGF